MERNIIKIDEVGLRDDLETAIIEQMISSMCQLPIAGKLTQFKIGVFSKNDTPTKNKYMTYEFDLYECKQEGQKAA